MEDVVVVPMEDVVEVPMEDVVEVPMDEAGVEETRYKIQKKMITFRVCVRISHPWHAARRPSRQMSFSSPSR
jgi:hypothetical protein